MSGNAKVGTIYVEFLGDTANYQKACDDVQKVNTGLNTGVINLNQSLDLLAKGLDLAGTATKIYVGATTEAYGSIAQFNRMTGTTVEQGGKWHDMLEKMGLDISDMSFAFKAFSNNVDTAFNDPKSGATLAFKKLGVSLTDSNGKLRDSNTLMLETLSALGRMPDGTAKNALAMDTLGRSYTNLSKVIAEGTDAQKEFANTTTDMTYQGMQDFKKYTDATNKFNASLKDIEVSVGSKMLPALTAITDFLTNSFLPTIDTVLAHISGMGQMFGKEMVVFGNAAFDVNDAIADTSIGKMLGFKPANRAGLNNYAAGLNVPLGIHNAQESYREPETGSGISSGGTSVFDQLGNYIGSGSSGSSGGSSGSGSGGSGSSLGSGGGSGGGSSGWTPYKMEAAKKVAMAAARGDLVGMHAAMIDLTRGPAWNQFENGMTNYDAVNPASPLHKQYADNGTDITGSATQFSGGAEAEGYGDYLDVATMANKLSNMETSPEVRAILNKYLSGYNPTQKEKFKEQYAWNSELGAMQGIGKTDQYGADATTRMGLSDIFTREFSRLTSGENAKYDTSGNVIVYLNLDGKQVSQAVFNKLQLLGVKT
jgi:uncharacterized membrane protein YgcG